MEAWAVERVLARLTEQLQQARIRVKVIIGLFNEPDDDCEGSPLIRAVQGKGNVFVGQVQKRLRLSEQFYPKR